MGWKAMLAAAGVLAIGCGGLSEAREPPRAALLRPASPAAEGFSPQTLAEMNAAMRGLVDKGAFPGVMTMLVRHGRVVDVQTYGKKNLATGAPIARDTIFRMYSQTKPVTGVAMMMLYEEGKWSLDDPVTKYVPEFADLKVFKAVGPNGELQVEPVARPPTMRELMTHTAGFAYGLVIDNPVDKAYRDSGLLGSKSLHDMVVGVAKLPMADQPGVRWKYSVAVDIQGYIVEKLSGQSLADFMRSRIFGPLGMKDTGFYVPAGKRPRQAALYAFDPKRKVLAPATGFMVRDVTMPPTAASGGGGLVSTAADYARFCQMLLNGGELGGARLLKPETVALMRTNQLSDAVLAGPDGSTPLGPGVGFGLDFAVVTDPAKAKTGAGRGTYSWGGAAGTWFWIDPENDLFFLGMIQVIGRPKTPDLTEFSQGFVYKALVDPAR